MAVQTNYSENIATAFEGMIANTEPNILISRTVEGAAIGFGKVVKQGAADYGVAAATAADDVYRGITVRDQSTTDDEFAVGDSALVITQGVIWVTAGEAVEAGEAVYMKVGTADAGKFMSTSTNNLAISGAVFDTSGAKDTLVAVRLA